VTKENIFVLKSYDDIINNYGFVRRFSRNGGGGVNVDSGLAYAFGGSAIIAQNNALFVSLYAHSWEANVYRSSDQGDHWESCNEGIAGENVISFASGQNVLAALTISAIISLSSNGGSSWIPLVPPPGTRPECITIGSSDQIYIGTKDDAVFSSADFGKNWNHKNNGLTVGYIGAIVADKSNLIIQTPANALYYSTNSGNLWELSSCNTGLLGTFLLHRNGILYAGADQNGLFRSTDYGKSWIPAMLGLPGYGYPPYGRVWINDVVSDSSGLVALVQSDSGTNGSSTLYAIYQSTDEGNNWHKISATGPRYNLLYSKNVLLIAGGLGIQRSGDNGKTWSTVEGTIMQSDINRMCEALGFVFAASLYPSRKLFRSSDQGLNWEEMGFPDASYIRDIIGLDEYLFAATENNVWRSPDLGKTWISASFGSTGRNIITFAAKGDTLISSNDLGIGVSTDLGGHWYTMKTNLPDNAIIEALTLRDEYLIAETYVPDSTTPNSIWQLPLSQVVASVKTPTRIDVPQSTILKQCFPNPFNPTTTISFTLAKSSFTTLTIYDILGRRVATLLGKILPAGNYSTVWNAGEFSSGVYFYCLRSGDFGETKKLLLQK
jgi:photosystem II stability/assembly factor-like uncharacterized protein